MAGKNTITSSEALYDHFKPHERFVLVFEAITRRDEAEADRLLHSCPRKGYEGPDAAFTDRLTLAFEMIEIACGDLRHLTGSLRTLHQAMATVAHFDALHHINASMAFVEGVRCGQGLSQSPFFAPRDERAKGKERRIDKQLREEVDVGQPADSGQRMEAVEERAEYLTDLIQKVLAREGNDIAAQLVSVWEAFSLFCRDRLSLPPEKALQACGYPAMADLTDALKLYADLKPDPESMAEYRDAMYGFWDRRFGQTD